MIARWKLFNFKSVGEETPLEFRPLTIFAGPNSSGKSTCIQSILLICQTFRNPIGSRSVVLNGSLARLGQFSDLKTTGSGADQIVIGWELRPISTERNLAPDTFSSLDEESLYDGDDAVLTSVECEVGFDARADVPNDPSQLNPQLFSTILRATFRDSDLVDHPFPFGISRAPQGGEQVLDWLSKIGVPDSELERVRPFISLRAEADEESLQFLRSRFVSGEVAGTELTHFLPHRIALAYNRADDQAQFVTNTIFGLARPGLRGRDRGNDLRVPVTALKVLRRILGPSTAPLFESNAALETLLNADDPISLSALAEALRQPPLLRRRQIQELLQSDPKVAEEFRVAVREDLPDEYRTALLAPSRGIRTSCQYMRRYFSQATKYLGPLRDEPKALYPLSNAADPFDIGLKGENTAAVLDLHKSRLVRFIPPVAFSQPAVIPEPITRTLQAAVAEWLRYLGVAESVESRDQGKLGHELKVRITKGGGDQDLTHVGVGVSQVLPILIMCLLADRDTALLFEQPELHLHPKVQTLLGDFFLSIALMDKQCVIETHSEYLINRLRFRAAAAPSDDVTKKMTIYFVERHGDRSHFRPVVVNEFGAIQDWPEGFFDQSQDEAESILREATRKRKAKGGQLPRAQRND
jgi:predicted ATPase